MLEKGHAAPSVERKEGISFSTALKHLEKFCSVQSFSVQLTSDNSLLSLLYLAFIHF